MKKLKFIAIALLLVSVGTSCTKNPNNDIANIAPSETPKATDESQEDLVNPFENGDLPTFSLSEEETKLYEKYISEKDINIFKDVPAQSVVKVFVQCGIEGELESEFNMFAPETLDGLTLEDYLKVYDSEQIKGTKETRQQYAGIAFSKIDEASFVDEGNTGYIEVTAATNEKLKLQLVKSKNNIWLINYDFIV